MKAIDVQIQRTSRYGLYRVTGTIDGITISYFTTDSEAFDYFNDDDHPEKQAEAKAHCEMILELAYGNL